MIKQKRGRHAPAFILLVLMKTPTHGLGVLNMMNEMVPNNRMDTAIIYRTLKDLENNGYIDSTWEDSGAGPKKKVYTVTSEGEKLLVIFKDDIEKSLSNLQTFLNLYDQL